MNIYKQNQTELRFSIREIRFNSWNSYFMNNLH
jgi:hypothetical protein